MSRSPGWKMLLRGTAKRCPRCGRGALFMKGTRMHDDCPACGIRYLKDRGDPWAFLVIIDRIVFISPIVVALYLGLHRASWTLFIGFALALGVLFLCTTPNRYGASVGLVHWVQARFGD